MRLATLLVGLLCLALPAAAQERGALYGSWGTGAQCARAPIQPGGTVLAAPFEIRPGWLRQGDLWCRLRWQPVQPRAGGLFTTARAQCGEDAVRDHQLAFFLEGDALRIRWNLTLFNGPLARCDAR